MGGSPPPPPPPKRQPLEWAKEYSMKQQNIAYDNAVAAAYDSYTSAIILKTLADILLPETETQLRNEINSHYQIVTEYRRSLIIYHTTVLTFLQVDSLVKASIDKLQTIRGVGETYLDAFDSEVVKVITNGVTELYQQQSKLQEMFIEAADKVAQIKSIYDKTSPNPLTTDEQEKAYNTHFAVIERLCNEANGIYSKVAMKIDEMTTAIGNTKPLNAAEQTKTDALGASKSSQANLRGVATQINDVYTANMKDYTKELERRRRWYEYYHKQANLVRERRRIVIDPAVFRRLMNWAQNAHYNAVLSALYAFMSGLYANIDRHRVHPSRDDGTLRWSQYTF